MRLAAVLLLLPALCFAEPATVIRATELKQQPAPGERLYALEKMQPTLDAYAGQPQLVDRFTGAARR